MIKRVTSITLGLLLCLQSTAFAFSDVDNSADYAKAADRLNALNIISGKGDGSFDPDGLVTRAEMAKIADVVADIEVQSSDSSLFSDMEEGNWANGYVNAVSSNGLILGYPDGTFQPDRYLTYAETVTITLRLLGYGSKVLGYNYPTAYLQKAKELGLTDGMDFSYDDYIDRKSTATLIDRALMTDINNGSSSRKTKLIETLDYSISDECIIIATNNESKELLSDEVVTSIGTYKKINNSIDELVTQTCKLILDKDKKIISAIPIPKESKEYIVQNVAGTEVLTDKGIIKMDNSASVYFKNKKATFSAVKDEVQTGTKMTVYYSQNGAYDYAVLTEYELLGPVVYTEKGDLDSLKVNYSELRVIRDGYESNIDSLQKYDVLYYDEKSNIVYSYCDKASGVYEKAYPNKANVTSIKLSGEIYTLETLTAAKTLGETKDSFKINDFITALLGKDGKIVAIVNNKGTDNTLDYGVLLSCSERVEDGTKNYYTKFLSASGIEQEFKVSMNYDEYRGKVAQYIFENGVLMPFFVDGYKVSGSVDKQNGKIGSYWLSKDCKVVDLAYAPGKTYEYESYEYGNVVETKTDDLEDYPNAVAKVIELSDITAAYLEESEVVDAQLDDNGNIGFLVLNNITMSRYKYGVIVDADKYSTSATYKIDFGGTVSTYSIDEAPRPNDSDVVMASIQDNKLVEIRRMDQVKTSGDYESIDKHKVKVGDVYYSLAKDAAVFLKNGDENFDVVSIDDLSEYTVNSMELYADKDITKGGQIRVIVFTEKAKQ